MEEVLLLVWAARAPKFTFTTHRCRGVRKRRAGVLDEGQAVSLLGRGVITKVSLLEESLFWKPLSIVMWRVVAGAGD